MELRLQMIAMHVNLFILIANIVLLTILVVLRATLDMESAL
jgi:hypothetical protein